MTLCKHCGGNIVDKGKFILFKDGLTPNGWCSKCGTTRYTKPVALTRINSRAPKVLTSIDNHAPMLLSKLDRKPKRRR